MGKQKFPEMENYNRINYLFQAAHAVLKENPQNVGLVQHYCLTLKNIARKNVLRLDPSMKRSICKKCCMLLIPGITASVRIRKRGKSWAAVTCLECQVVKRFVVNKEHELWTDSPSAWEGQVPVHLQ